MSILNQEEIIQVQAISNGKESIYKKRAIALLSINSGNTQVKAAEDSTLSVGQVRYFLNKFRTVGISCFPQELLDTKPIKEEVLPTVETPVINVETKEKAVKKPKKKKEKSKDKKKEKETKKVKKEKSKKTKEKKSSKKDKEKKKPKKKKEKK